MSLQPRGFTVFASALAVAASITLAGCGGSQRSVGALPATSATSSATTIPSVVGAALVDDWTTYAHDQLRTGYQPQATGISASNVAGLKPRWLVNLGEPVKASPLVANGVVYVAGQLGTVRALDVASGKTLWTTNIGGDVQMTPTLADGLVFVGTHSAPFKFLALDASAGTTHWSVSLRGAIRGEPVVLNGIVYVGDASGDPPTCNQGGIHGFGETTGASVLTWYDDPKPNDGGAVWSPISTDGQALYFGTGNTCSPGATYGNSEVKLGPTGSVAWAFNAANVLEDNDVGSGSMLLGNDVVATDKNGTIYDFDRLSGSIVWQTKIGFLDGYGPIGSASSDGQIIIDDGGYISSPLLQPRNPGAYIYGISRSGNVLWKNQINDEVRGNIPINNGVAYGGIDGALVALDIRSGAKLWSYPLGNATVASPAIVPSGLYYADQGGNVYAFSLPGGTTTDVRRRAEWSASSSETTHRN